MKSDQLLAAVLDPLAVAQQQGPGATLGRSVAFVDSLSSIVWIDWTALSLLFVFFLLGLFKGFVWQICRILTLLGAWFLAGRYGPEGETTLNNWLGAETSAENIHLFLAYVVIFVVSVVVFSLVTWLVQKLVKDTGLTLYDRLGGAVLGLGTGGIGVIAILAVVYMFVPSDFRIVEAAHGSRSMEFSQRALRLLGKHVPEPMQQVFGLQEKKSAIPGGHASGEDAQKGPTPDGTVPKDPPPSGTKGSGAPPAGQPPGPPPGHPPGSATVGANGSSKGK